MTVIASDVFTLNGYADQVLSTAAVALADTVDGTPDIVYVSTEPPAYDCCPALIVTVGALQEAQTQPNVPVEEQALRGKLGAITLATYLVTVLRCAAPPTASGSPSIDAMTEVAHQTQQDVWALWNGLRNAWRDGDIFELCIGVHWDGCRPIREQGGCVGWELQIRALIPGINA